MDELADKLHISRSAFARDALKEALHKYHLMALERKHKNGYLRYPSVKGEFDIFVKEQDKRTYES